MSLKQQQKQLQLQARSVALATVACVDNGAEIFDGRTPESTLLLQPVHPGTVGRGRTSCVYHRSIKKKCPDDCNAKQDELVQEVRQSADATRPVAVIVPLAELRANAELKRRAKAAKKAAAARAAAAREALANHVATSTAAVASSSASSASSSSSSSSTTATALSSPLLVDGAAADAYVFNRALIARPPVCAIF